MVAGGNSRASSAVTPYPDWLDRATILRTEVGSGVHGLALGGTDDLDEMGICIEPMHVMVTTQKPFEQYVYRTAEARTGKHDAPSQPGDLDLTVYSLRKWCSLALAGNPTVLLPMFAPVSSCVVLDYLGVELRRMSDAFASKQSIKRFLGYMVAQRERLLGQRGQKNVNRRELVERVGYDSKYASHVIRLGLQGVEYGRTGRLTLPMKQGDRDYVLQVKRGECDLEEVIIRANALEVELEDALESSPLPDCPDTERVNAWMRGAYLNEWTTGDRS